MVEITNLSKRYGNNVAVDNISFTVNKGEILGFLGPNGAGKSTTMNILTGYLSSTSGSAKIDGFDILDDPIRAKEKIGYLPEQPPLYLDMTVLEYLDFVCDLKKVDPAEKEKHILEIMNTVRIPDVYDRVIANLSKGYRQRVGLAQALVGNPEVLILDEPTVGLDPKQIIEIRDVIKKLGRSHTVILSSHILQEVSAICERVIIINKGKIVASDTPENLSKAISNENRFQIRVKGEERAILDCIQAVNGIKYAKSLGRKEANTIDFVLEAEPNVDIREPLFHVLADKRYPIMLLKSLDLSLEDIFLRLTQDDGAFRFDSVLSTNDEDIEVVGRQSEPDGQPAPMQSEETTADIEAAIEEDAVEFVQPEAAQDIASAETEGEDEHAGDL